MSQLTNGRKDSLNQHPVIELIPIEQLKPYPGNARTHSPRQIKKLTKSMKRFGVISPIIIDSENTIIAGHARFSAVNRLELTHVPVIRVEHLSEEEIRAYRLADNRLAEDAEWDNGLLKLELSALAELEIDFDVELTGFATPEIDILLGAATSDIEAKPDPAVPMIPRRAISKRGDIWKLGKHRLGCADARDPVALDTLMAGREADMAFCDPPYNTKITGHVCGLGRHQHRDFPMASGEMDSPTYTGFLILCFGNVVRVSRSGAVHDICIDWRHIAELLEAGREIYSELLNLVVWAKTNGGMGSLYRSQHEFIAIFKVGTVPHINNVELGRHGRYRTNLWQYPGMNSFSAERDEALAMHPTVKPVQLVADAILDVTHRGDLVLDSFMGSGTTILAAEQTGRIAYGLEIDPAYVDVAVQRWQTATGENAILEGSVETFAAVTQARSRDAQEGAWT